MLHHFHSIGTCLPPSTVSNRTASEDARLLATYDPATSLAWLGAMPDPGQGDLFSGELSVEDAASDLKFAKAGFTVRQLAGKGSRALLSEFTARYHYLSTAGMSGGIAFGLFAPTGRLVGISNFARPTQPKTAAGMFPPAPADPELGDWSQHADVAESEVLDFVRLTVMSSEEAGCNLGTGAESFFVRQAIRALHDRNREKWRAIRRVELGLAPLPNTLAARPWLKCIRTFADPHQAHQGKPHDGTAYRASGMLRIGESRAERVWVGLRSGHVLSGRQRSKLMNRTDRGHLANGLRAAWEGAACVFEGRDASGAVVATRDLSVIATLPTLNMSVAKRIARALVADATHLSWSVRFIAGGFAIETRPKKPRFALFLGVPPVARALARRCRYLRSSLLHADAAWFAPERRGGRGAGFNWPRRPTDHALLAWVH